MNEGSFYIGWRTDANANAKSSKLRLWQNDPHAVIRMNHEVNVDMKAAIRTNNLKRAGQQHVVLDELFSMGTSRDALFCLSLPLPSY